MNVATTTRRLRDSQAFNPAAWKLGIGVAVAVIVFLVLAFGGIAAATHRNDVISHLAADWRSSAGDSSTHLSIWPQTAEGIVEEQAPAVTPLRLSGVLDGQKVSGEVKVPRWPPLGSAGYAVVSGARWTLHLDLAHDTLTVVTADGRSFTLLPSR